MAGRLKQLCADFHFQCTERASGRPDGMGPASKVDGTLIDQLADLSFTEAAHNAVIIGGPGTGKTRLCTALGVAGITRHGNRVWSFSTLDLEREKAKGKAGRIAANLMSMDVLILDALININLG